MLFTIRSCNVKQLSQIKKLFVRKLSNFSKKQCLCGSVYTNDLYFKEYKVRNVRVHSTQSDQHRQKVVIETVQPKISIDKLAESLKAKQTDKDSDVIKSIRDKIDPYIKLGRWDKPIGIYLLYWPCSWSIVLGSLPGQIDPATSCHMLALFLCGAGLMRSAGCTVNDLWDEKVDRQVERTKDRPLVTGVISKKQAVAYLGVQLSLALGVLLQLNCYSVILGASSMLLVVTYPLAKRFTNYPQIFLGATFNWGALLGYAAVQGHLDYAVCLPLYAGSLAWTVIYDTIYAHQDKLDDARIGLKSTALTFGRHTRPILATTLAASASCLYAAGVAAGLGVAYDAALAAYVAYVGRQIYTLNIDNPDDCAKKFKSNSMVGLIILLGILGGGLEKYIDNRNKNQGIDNSHLTKSCFLS